MTLKYSLEHALARYVHNRQFLLLPEESIEVIRTLRLCVSMFFRIDTEFFHGYGANC
jgi:hypothetical protein